jgi:hypothetical protein
VVNDCKLFSFVTACSLRIDGAGYPCIYSGRDRLCHAFHRRLPLQHQDADHSSGVGVYAYGIEPGSKAEMVYAENEIATFRPLPCCGSYRPSFDDSDWLSYWDCRYEAPQLSMALVRTIARRPARYPSEYHAEGRFVGSLAYSLLFDLLSR